MQYVKRTQRWNGSTPAHLKITDELKDNGVIFTDIFTAVKEHGDLVQKYFMTDGVKVDENKLTALHAALLNGGTFLYVPKNVELTEPVQAVFIHDNAEVAMFNHGDFIVPHIKREHLGK